MQRIRKMVRRLSCTSGQREADDEQHKKKRKDRASFSDLGTKKPMEVPNDKNKSGLVPRQVFLLKQNWKGVMRNEEDFGIELHERLFKTNTELKSMFHKFKELNTDDEMRSNEALEYHATMVMTTLDDTITHIDNYDFIRQLLTKTGASHFRFSGFEPKTFLNIKQPFLDAVKVTLGDRYTENMENIYKIAINFILDTLVEGLQEELDKAKENDTSAAKVSS